MKNKPLFAALLLFGVRLSFAGSSLSERLDSVLKHPDTVTPQLINDSGNSDLVVALKHKAQNPRETAARVALLNAEDPETTQRCVNDLNKEASYDRGYAAQALSLSRRPQIIVLLAGYLKTSESATVKRIQAGEEVDRITPISVLAARIIRQIVLRSSAFSQSVTTWAAQLSMDKDHPQDWETSRAAIRKWFEQNESLLSSNRYGDVQPPN